MLISGVNDGIADARSAQSLADVVRDDDFVAAHCFAQFDCRCRCRYPTILSR